MAKDVDGGFPLQEMINSLRRQLEASMDDAAASRLKFELAPIELELKIAASSTAGVNGGVGWSIFKLGAKAESTDQTVHTLRLTLKPALGNGSAPSFSGAVAKRSRSEGEG